MKRNGLQDKITQVRKKAGEPNTICAYEKEAGGSHEHNKGVKRGWKAQTDLRALK